MWGIKTVSSNLRIQLLSDHERRCEAGLYYLAHLLTLLAASNEIDQIYGHQTNLNVNKAIELEHVAALHDLPLIITQVLD